MASSVTMATEARLKIGLSQSAFAGLMGVSKRTLQEWEQGRREPSGAAKTLLKVDSIHPEVMRELIQVWNHTRWAFLKKSIEINGGRLD